MKEFLTNPVFKRLATSVVRAALVAFGTTLVTKGIVSEADWLAVVAALSPVLASLLWSTLEEASKKNNEQQ